MDSTRQVYLTMTEIKEIIYQLQIAIKAMETESSYEKPDESGIRDEKKVFLQHIIHKLEAS